MRESDIADVIRMHGEYIPGALFPKLGKSFMEALYKSMIKLDEAKILVWEQEGEVLGFITATTDAGILMKKVMLQNFPLFMWRTLIYLAGNPLRISEVWETLTYSKLADLPGVTGEFLFIALEKEARKKEVSDLLVKECMRWLAGKGKDKIKVTTYTTNRGANTLLKRQGFRVEKVLPFRNKEINMFLYDGEESSRQQD